MSSFLPFLAENVPAGRHAVDKFTLNRGIANITCHIIFSLTREVLKHSIKSKTATTFLCKIATIHSVSLFSFLLFVVVTFFSIKSKL